MIETSVTYVSAQMQRERVQDRGDAAIASGITTAGSVPKTKSRMMSAPMAPISVSARTPGPLVAALRLEDRVATGEMGARLPAGRRLLQRRPRRLDRRKAREGRVPGRIDRGDHRVPVLREVHRVVRVEPRADARALGRAGRRLDRLRTPATFVMSLSGAVRTTTIGTCSPVPNVFSVRWFASYA